MKKIFIHILTISLILAPVASAQFELFESLLETPREVEQNDFQLDVVWETNTAIPPEYAGKALPSAESIIIVTALTPAKNLAALTFAWSLEDSTGAIKMEHSSLAKNQFAFKAGGILRSFSHVVSVRAEETITGQAARKRVSIPIKEPETLVRAVSPSGALLEPSISVLTLQPGSSLSLLARTFFFTSEPEALQYSWLFDGDRVFGGGSPEKLDLSISSRSGKAAKNLILEALLPESNRRAVSTVKVEVTP